jgi:hypothetical protein
MKYYVYEFWDTRSNTPFYVGKGTGSRCFDARRNDAVEARIQELNSQHEIRIVLKTNAEHEAFDHERKLIAKYGSVITGTGSLLNIASLLPVPSPVTAQTKGKNWKSPWHLARSGGTKEEVALLTMRNLRSLAREIKRKPIAGRGYI